MPAGLAGLVERGFAASFVVKEEGFLPEGPDEVGGGGAERYLHTWLPVLKVDNIVCETSNRKGPKFAATRSSCHGSEHGGRRW